MSNINAAPDARIHALYRLQYIQRRMPQFIFRPVIVDGHADVVILYELLNPRQSLRRRVARDNHANPRPLAVFEFAPDVGILIFREINGSGSVKLDARRGIICQRGLLLLGIQDRKSTRLNSSHITISYAVFCLKKKKKKKNNKK